QFGDLLPVFREVKDAFDPLNLLNPGKVVGDASHPAARDLRAWPAAAPVAAGPAPGAEELPPATPPSDVYETNPTAPAHGSDGPLRPVRGWGERGPVETAAGCNGCGLCRSREPGGRMCPTFRALRDERATPRALANLVRQLAAGRLDPKLWGAEEFAESARLCTHCKLCPSECPSGVDVSSLMVEAKAAYVETHGLPPGA